MKRWSVCFLVLGLVGSNAWSGRGRNAEDPGAATNQLQEAALGSPEPMALLTDLCDTAGPRLAGSEGLNRAIAWSVQHLEQAGFENVHTEPVTVRAWIRGAESARLVTPRARPLHILGLGNSVGTGGETLEAEVVAVTTFEELDALAPEAVQGRIVLFNAPFTAYRDTVVFRTQGPSKAAARGAVAALVRSISPPGLATPHTGATGYAEDIEPIPAAALPHEEADLLYRLVAAGEPVRVALSMEAHFGPDAQSANVVADIPGRDDTDEKVLLACHLDSWDVGEGAQDDGAGCVIAMEAARLVGALETRPRRGIRVVLYTNEENGLAGGKAYAEAHADEMSFLVAALEADTGSGMPLGYRLDVRKDAGVQDEARHRFQAVLDLLAPLDAGTVRLSRSGADIGPLAEAGVPGLGLHQDTSGYWPIHHTWADTVDKVDPEELTRSAAAMAGLAWMISELPGRLDD